MSREIRLDVTGNDRPMRRRAVWHAFVLGGTIAVALLAPSRGTEAYTFKTIYDFCQGNACGGGDYPDGSLFIDGAGNLYSGGTKSIRLSPGAPQWDERTLFSSGDPGLIDGGGAVFGVTVPGRGGKYGFGDIFKLTPNASRTKWTAQTLYSFCSVLFCKDGAVPNYGLVKESASIIYGTTTKGGANCPKSVGCGTAYMLQLHKGKWVHSVIHSFLDPSVRHEGAEPTANVIVGSPGHLYGTTSTSGAHGAGTVF
jgi:hypothetical protein